jgi:hypothetical protein
MQFNLVLCEEFATYTAMSRAGFLQRTAGKEKPQTKVGELA